MKNIENKIRRIRQSIFNLPDDKQEKATRVIEKLKSKLPAAINDYHWRYAAE